MKGQALLAGLAGLLLALTAIGTPGASAQDDDAPCGPVQDFNGIDAQICPLWRDNVPVLFDGETVGQLDEGGSANWFICESKFPGAVEQDGALKNDWWAITKADNGEIGWVSEVWFEGGDNFKPDAGLKSCGPGPFSPGPLG